jgi:hypothetical protein
MNKRRARKAHLIRRARERFGLELTNEDLIAIKRQITAQSAVCLREGTTRLTSHNQVETFSFPRARAARVVLTPWR